MTAPQALGKALVGYFTGWAIHGQNYQVADIPADLLTHVNYAFAAVSQNGECVSISRQDDQINFPALQQLKQNHPGLKTLISIGGAAHSGYFSTAAATPGTRAGLAQSCVAFMLAGGFDGIDVAWDFPGPADKANFTALLKELRSQLDMQAGSYLLTGALPATPDRYANVELSQFHQYLDWVNLKAYDFYAASSPITHFAAPLYAAPGDPEPDAQKRSAYNVSAAVQAYLAAGVPAAKLIVGVPFVGCGWSGAPDVNHGLYQPAGGPAQGTWANDGVFDFEDLCQNYIGRYQRFWSTEASAPWLYSPDTEVLISYDDAESLGLKAGYVSASGLGGVMAWPLSADDSESSLVNALAVGLGLAPQNAASGAGSTSASGAGSTSASGAGSTSASDPKPLTNSTTSMPKATYVPLTIPPARDVGGATRNFAFVASLGLLPGEVAAVRSALSAAVAANESPLGHSPALFSLLTQFEGTPLPAQLPLPSAFADIATTDLISFGNELSAIRQQRVDSLQPAGGNSPATAAEVLSSAPQSNAAAANALNAALVATASFTNNGAISPIGMMHLETLQMTPAGIERGGLLATIPLAPSERTQVVQQEWSVTSQEFTSIVTDSLENYSETGVTENTQLTQAATSQIAHSNQFNVSASASGGCGFVTGSASASSVSQDQISQSETDSRTHAVQTTQKASSRVTQSHKTTISNTTSSGASEATTRMLVNPSATDPMRIDYFSIMRKWYVALYRYGLRLTYDVTVPEPGAAMREAYRCLAVLQKQASQAFDFSLDYSAITRATYQDLASQCGAVVPDPPDPDQLLTVGGNAVQGLSTSGGIVTYWPLQFTIPTGYWITGFRLVANIEGNYAFQVMGYPEIWSGAASNQPNFIDTELVIQGTNPSKVFMQHAEGTQTVTCYFKSANPAMVQFFITVNPTDATMAQWQAQVWSALYNAAQQTFYAQQQTVSAQIAALQQQIDSVDTLTLRREENDEIMKCVLRWLLGPSFDFMPADVVSLFQQSGGDLQYGINFTGSDTSLSTADWTILGYYEAAVNFINQAIDWDNTIYFLYSYFWDVPPSWDFIRKIQHPDATRQAFLRAGSARVVLTVRPGWEVAWTYFVEYWGTVPPDNLPGHPYLTIAQQIQDYDSTNYPGIPPANPGGPANQDTPQVGTTCDQDLQPSPSPVTIPVADSTGFVPGATAIIDTWDPNSQIQETQPITAVPDATHVTVQALSNAHSPVKNVPFPVVQAGTQGVLIAEWFEYTPTSGTDIAVSSDLSTIT